jgi:type I restriction enzyme, S subunit
MDISKVTNQILTERLDAEFYRPAFLENADCLYHLDNCIKLGEASNQIKLGYTGPTEKYYSQQGAFYLSSKNIVDGVIVLDEQTDKISLEAHKGALKATSVQCGDLLISRTGNVGKCAILYDSEQYYNIAAHLIAIRLNKDLDKEYVSIFFNTRFGQLQTCRIQRGTIIHGLSIHDLPNLLIPKFNYEVQVYIGDKVRQAERLRDRSRHLEKEINTFFIVKGWDGDLPGNSKSFKALASAINPGRLDAAFYDPAYLRLEDCLKASKSIAISTLAKQVKKGWNKDMDEFLYFEIGSIDLGSGTIKPSRQRVVDAPSRAQLSIKAWDILVSTVRPNRKNVALVLESDENLELVASNGFSVLRFPSKEEAVFYHSWLRLDAATLQMMRWNAGGSYPAIDDSIAISTLVPDFPDEVVKNQGQKWLIKFIGKDFSERLTMAAKLLVEALIEGKISEGDLKAAQEGLEKSEITLDREILARLTRKGIDCPNEPPLFPDLDALYNALASLNKTEAIEAANPGNSRAAKVYHLRKTPLALASEAPETSYAKPKEVPE